MRRFSEVDVFAAGPYSGNALAVVYAAEGLSAEAVQCFAQWTILAETAFLCSLARPGADYRVRIFSTSEEPPFAGHPTLGSAAAWLRADGERRAFSASALARYERLDASTLNTVAATLGVEPDIILGASWIANGPEWIGVGLASADDVLALRPNPADLGTLRIGLIGPPSEGRAEASEVRAFVGGDPVTGSISAGLDRWLHDGGVVGGGYVAAHRTVVGRRGRANVSYEGGEIWVSGQVTGCVSGEVRL